METWQPAYEHRLRKAFSEVCNARDRLAQIGFKERKEENIGQLMEDMRKVEVRIFEILRKHYYPK